MGKRTTDALPAPTGEGLSIRYLLLLRACRHAEGDELASEILLWPTSVLIHADAGKALHASTVRSLERALDRWDASRKEEK